MSDRFPLSEAEAVVFDGIEYEIDRAYFKAGIVNDPIRVWVSDGAEVHYRPQTAEVVVIELETGDTTFVEPVETDGDTVQLEERR